MLNVTLFPLSYFVDLVYDDRAPSEGPITRAMARRIQKE